MDSIQDMTLEQLKALIDERISAFLIDHFEISDDTPEETRSWDDVKTSIKRHRWTPPPGTPSVVELLRTDRER